MNAPTSRHPAPRFRAAFALCSALLAVSCQKHEAPSASAPSPSGSSSAGAALAGPCGDFVKKVCDKAGDDSGNCKHVTATAALLSPAACAAVNKDVEFTLSKLNDQRRVCDQLVARLCADIGKQSETCKLIEAKTKEFPPDQCVEMMQNYDQVLAGVKRMETENAPLSAELQTAIAASDAPSFGPANAKVTIVEFSDFQCPYCSRAASVAQQIKKKYGDRVRFVFRQFPLNFHDKAKVAAEASLAANAQGKFWQFHDKLFENQSALAREDLETYAKQLGLNAASFKKALDDGQYSAAVEADLKLGNSASVQGTPSMFLNGKRVANPTDFDAVAKLIDAELAG